MQFARLIEPGEFSSLDMNMTGNVVHAVAVIAVALGAVAEFHVGVVRIGYTTHGTFVEVSFGLLRFFLCFFEVDCLGVGAVLHTAEQAGEIAGKEQEVVGDGQQRDQCVQEIAGKHVTDNRPGEECRIQPGQPLDLDGDDKENQKLCVGVQGGKGEEHGQVHIAHGGIAGQKAQKHIQNHAYKIEQGKLGAAPFPFQCSADHPIQVCGQGEVEKPAVQGQKYKGQKPPYLSLQDVGDGKVQELGEHTCAEHIQQVDSRRAEHDDVHQVGNAKPGMLMAKAIKPGFDRTQ